MVYVSSMLEGRDMDTGIREEICSKLNLVRVSRPALIGMAAILVLVAVASVNVLSGTAAASNYEVSNTREEPDWVRKESADAEAAPTIFVHVSGAVNNPGLYEVDAGSRVASAVQAAGGYSDDAATDSVNLARVLEDGEQVVIARVGDDVGAGGAQAGAGQAGAGQGAGQGAAQATTQGKLNINSASAAELETLPGIGPSTAQKIVSERTANGSFKSVDDLMRVSGIGEKKLAAIADLICV